MKGWIRLVAFAGAIILLVFTFINASWLAGTSPGGVRLIAHRGVSQLFDHTDLKRDDCTATRIEQPVHDYLENTVRSMQAARQMGADVVEIDIARPKMDRSRSSTTGRSIAAPMARATSVTRPLPRSSCWIPATATRRTAGRPSRSAAARSAPSRRFRRR
nr:hypothetical protein [Sphingomonas daechungensis]